MPCKYKGKSGICPKTNCSAGDHCQARNKNGGDSTKEVFSAMLVRLRDHIKNGEVHFGKVIADIRTHISVCEKSAKKHLEDMHLEKYVEILPSIQKPQTVRILVQEN